MQQAVALAKLLEQQPRVLAASVAAGFSLADFHDAGMAVLIGGYNTYDTIFTLDSSTVSQSVL